MRYNRNHHIKISHRHKKALLLTAGYYRPSRPGFTGVSETQGAIVAQAASSVFNLRAGLGNRGPAASRGKRLFLSVSPLATRSSAAVFRCHGRPLRDRHLGAIWDLNYASAQSVHRPPEKRHQIRALTVLQRLRLFRAFYPVSSAGTWAEQTGGRISLRSHAACAPKAIPGYFPLHQTTGRGDNDSAFPVKSKKKKLCESRRSARLETEMRQAMAGGPLSHPREKQTAAKTTAEFRAA